MESHTLYIILMDLGSNGLQTLAVGSRGLKGKFWLFVEW